MSTLSVVVLAVALTCAHGAAWTKASCACSAAVGSCMPKKNPMSAFVAGGDNGVGAELIETTNLGNFTGVPLPGMFMALDVGISPSDPKSLAINGLFGAKHSADGGKTFAASLGGGGQGQSVEGFGTNSFGIAGGFGGKDSPGGGVAVSTDGGKTFKHFGTGAALDAQHPARYAAFPTEDVWYVSAGAWPDNAGKEEEGGGRAAKDGSVLVRALSERHDLRRDPRTGRAHVALRAAPAAAGVGNFTGYTAAIAKTTDGGKTFTRVFSQDGEFYFNGIHCFDADHCAAAAEAHGAVSAPGGHVFTTADGGKTWAHSLFDAGGGMMGARMVGRNETIAAGTGGTSMFNMEGRFWHSGDGAQTFQKSPLKGLSPISIDCADRAHCVAPGVTSMQQGAIAVFE